MTSILFFLESAFSLWMLVDAYSRPQVPRFWFFVILLPFGELFYFAKFKIHDPDFAWLKAPFSPLLEKPNSIQQLRFNLEETPSLDNKVALALALHDNDEFEDSAALFEEALETNDQSWEALYGLGVSRMGSNAHEQAIEPLKKLIELEPHYREYDGWAKLAHALWQVERRTEALDSLAKLVKISPRLGHRVLYAYFLAEDGHRDAAQEQLITAIKESESAPNYLKRHNRNMLKRAKEMLEQLSASPANEEER